MRAGAQVNQVQFNQIKAHLEGQIVPSLDVRDLQKLSPLDRAQNALSRALAALVLMDKAGLTAEQAAGFITDGSADDGIDALHFDEKSTTLFIVQAKFLNDSTKGVPEEAFTKPRDGFGRLMDLKFGKKNANLKRMENTIKFAMQSTDLKCRLIIVTTSQQPLGDGLKEMISEFCHEQNSLTEDFFEVENFDVRSVFEAIRRSARSERFTADLMLHEWGRLTEPYVAFYGQASARALVEWYEEIGVRLFADNLRYGLGNSETNRGIARTVQHEYNHFFYYNNGITIVAENIDKAAVYGVRRESGVFKLSKISVINGAQTITSLSTALKGTPNEIDPLVLVKIISLEGSPPEFVQRITRFNNTQNRIESVDFVSLDQNQERFRLEAQLLGIKYAYRSGEPNPNDLNGFHFRQAAVAAACASGRLEYAVTAKRYISGLWENTASAPYTTLFNPQVTARDLWLRVRIDREIEAQLTRAARKRIDEIEVKTKTGSKTSATDNADADVKFLNLAATHSIRFVSFCVFNALSKHPETYTLENVDAACKSSQRLTDELFKLLIPILKGSKGKGYLGNLFKNKERQAAILEELPRKFHS